VKITRRTVVNDDGTGATGTVWNGAWMTQEYDDIDAALQTTITLTDGATPALDAALGTVYRLAAAGDRTIGIPTNPSSGQRIVIQHFASGGARTLALNTGTGGFRFGSTITGLTATASGKTDYIEAVYNATDNKWDVITVTKGF